MSQRFIDIANFDYNRSPTHKNTRAKAVSMLHRGATSLNPTFLAQSEVFEEPSSPFSPNFHLNPKQASGKLVQIPLEKMEFEEVQSFKATHRQMSINREIPKNSSQNLDGKLSETDKQIFASLRKRNKSNLLNVGTTKNHDEKLKKPKRRKSKFKPPIDLCKTLGLGFFGISKNSVKSPKDGLAKKGSGKTSTVEMDMQLYLKKAMQPYKIKRTVLNHKMLEPKLHPENLFPSTKIRKNVLTSRLAYSSKLGERGKS